LQCGAVSAFHTAPTGVGAPSYRAALRASCSRPRWGRGGRRRYAFRGARDVRKYWWGEDWNSCWKLTNFSSIP